MNHEPMITIVLTPAEAALLSDLLDQAQLSGTPEALRLALSALQSIQDQLAQAQKDLGINPQAQTDGIRRE